MKSNSVVFAILLVLIVVSCTNKQGGIDKLKHSLDSLKTIREGLNKQITALEQELALVDTSKKQQIFNVSSVTIKPTSFEHFIEVQGKVDGDDNVGVSAKGMGVVTKIFVKEGETVKQGQILAQIDDQVMKQGLQEIETQLELVTTVYNKQKALWDQKIGSEMQYLGAKANKEAMEKRKNSLLEQIEMMKIESPINGTIEEIPIKIGQTVAPGLPVFRVVNFDQIKIMADVAEAYSAQISKGNTVRVFFPDLNEEVNASIDFSSRFISPINRTFSIVARIPSEGIDYRANMIAVLKIRDYYNDKAITLPLNVVQSDISGQYVFVAKDINGEMIATKQLVKTGKSFNGTIEITSGLGIGDKVINAGYQELVGGEKILMEN